MLAWCCSLLASCSPVWIDKPQNNFLFFPLGLWADLGEQHGSLSFLAEVPSQALTAWVWLTVGCCVLQTDPKPKCSCPVLLLQRGCRPSGNVGMLLFRSCLHIIISTMIQSPSSSSPKHSCGFQKPHITSLILPQPTADQGAEEGEKQSRRSYMCGREVEFSWKRHWTYIFREFFSDTSSFDRSQWSPELRWTRCCCMRPCMTHLLPCFYTECSYKAESEKTGNLVLVCGQNFLQAQGYVIHHPIESPVVPFFHFLISHILSWPIYRGNYVVVKENSSL